MTRNSVRYSLLALLLISLFNALVTVPRLGVGIPLGIDSTSHLNKILFIYTSFRELGYVSSWSPDWYCGTPFLMLYPPLAYYLVFLISLSGSGVLLAYKAADVLFYVLTPITVFLLSRRLGLDAPRSITAAAVFSATPVVMENYVFFDRYPNIVTLPASILFIASLKTFLDKEGWSLGIPVASILLSFVILTQKS